MRFLLLGMALLAADASAARTVDSSWTGHLLTEDESIEIHLDFFDSRLGPQVRLTFPDLGRRYTTATTTGESIRFAVDTVRHGYLELDAGADTSRMSGTVRGDVFGTLALRRIEPCEELCADAAGWYARGSERLLLTFRPRGGMLMVVIGEDSLAMGERFPQDDRLIRIDRAAEADESIELTRDDTGRVASIVRRSDAFETEWLRQDDPYRQSRVTFRSGGLRMAGTLFEPVGSAPLAALATIQGSLGGRLSTRENFWQLHVADRLARRGVAVLVPDKRGCGDSDGEWTLASIDDLAEDAIASVARLRELIGEGTPVGLLGLSEGGWVAPAAGSRPGATDFIVSVSASTRNATDNSMYEIERLATSAGLSDESVAEALRLQAVATDYVRSRSDEDWSHYLELRATLLEHPDLRGFIEPFPVDTGNPRVIQLVHRAGFDPVAHWLRVRVPVFAAWGTEDIRVPGRESRDRLSAALASSSNPVPRELHLYEGSGHSIDDPATGRLSEKFVDDLVRWLESTVYPGSLRGN
jgi:pimeloyl-ACP methyl ester carboxylesterase